MEPEEISWLFCGQPPVLFGLSEAVMLVDPLSQQTSVPRLVDLGTPLLCWPLLVFPQPSDYIMSCFLQCSLSWFSVLRFKVITIELLFNRNIILGNLDLRRSLLPSPASNQSAGSSLGLLLFSWRNHSGFSAPWSSLSVFLTPIEHLVIETVPLGLCFT